VVYWSHTWPSAIAIPPLIYYLTERSLFKKCPPTGKSLKKALPLGPRMKHLKVIPQFCIAHFYCAHLITYNFIHYTYRLNKNNFMTILFVFSKKAYKSVARVPVSVVYLFTCISRFNATIP
jgi:hypothetical protein